MQKQTVVINMRWDVETVRKIRELAEHEQRAISAMVRFLIREAYEKYETYEEYKKAVAVAESLAKSAE